MDAHLQKYLNNHLAGSAGAMDLIESLAESCGNAGGRDFFIDLKSKIEADRAVLKELIEALGHSPSSLLQMAGGLAAAAGKLKLHWEGLAPGELGRFEAMEMLCLGIQGKRLLWAMLARLQPEIPEWAGFDFRALEESAIKQRNGVEEHRIAAGIASLAGG